MERDFSRRYETLDEWHWWFRGRRRVLEAVLDRELRHGVAREVVSVGCGPVRRLEWLRPYAGEGRITGLDAEQEHAAPVCPPGTAFVLGSAEILPFATGTIDLLVAADVLEHLRHDHAAMAEIVRVIRPGGLIVITVPALPSLWGAQDIVSHHFRRYTKRSLRELLRAGQLPEARVQVLQHAAVSSHRSDAMAAASDRPSRSGAERFRRQRAGPGQRAPRRCVRCRTRID